MPPFPLSLCGAEADYLYIRHPYGRDQRHRRHQPVAVSGHCDDHPAAAAGWPEEYILGGERPLSGTSYQRRWTYYCKGIGLAHYKIVTRKSHHKGKEYTTNAKVWEADVTAHQFRHEFASILYEANVGELEAQKLLGHSDITTTRRIYTHIWERQLENAAAQIENYIQTTSK